jgi:hypothetical protein
VLHNLLARAEQVRQGLKAKASNGMVLATNQLMKETTREGYNLCCASLNYLNARQAQQHCSTASLVSSS